VRGLDDAPRTYSEKLGLKIAGGHELDEEELRVSFVSVEKAETELVEPTDKRDPVADPFIDEIGVRLVNEKTRIGAKGHTIAFLHPNRRGGY